MCSKAKGLEKRKRSEALENEAAKNIVNIRSSAGVNFASTECSLAWPDDELIVSRLAQASQRRALRSACRELVPGAIIHTAGFPGTRL